MYKFILQLIFFIILLILKKIKYFFFLENGRKVRVKEKNKKGICKNVILCTKIPPKKLKKKNHKQILKEVKYKKT